MTDTTHDPPTIPVPQGLDLRNFTVDLPAEKLALLSGAGFEKYVLMRDRMGGKEPIAVVALMKNGGFRYKSKRGMPGTLVHRKGHPVPDLMSFRQIAPVLTELSGVPVTYETIRRWYDIVFPGEAVDDPAEIEEEEELAQLTPVPAASVPVKRATRRVTRRTPAPVVGDEHAAAIRAATDRAKTTNPDVPSAVFLSPTD